MKKYLFNGLTLVGLFFSTELFSQTVVTPCNSESFGWVKQPPMEGNISWKDSPQPLAGFGSSSLEFDIPACSENLVRMRNTKYDGFLLSSFEEFSYSTYVQARDDFYNDFFIVLQIDNGIGTIIDNLVFEPKFQSQITIENDWQNWDAMNGVWWIGPPRDPSLPSNPSDPSEPKLDPCHGGKFWTIAEYKRKYSNAKIVKVRGLGGIRLTAGAPQAGKKGFRGNVDNFKIVANGITNVFDFDFKNGPPVYANAGLDLSVVFGYKSGSNCAQLTGNATGGVGSYSYSWSPGGSTPESNTTQVCPEITTTYTLKVTDANGNCGTSNVRVKVNDVRCGDQLEKVLLCHDGNEMCVNHDEARLHLLHGDILGSCLIPFPYWKWRKFPLNIWEFDPLKTNTKIIWEFGSIKLIQIIKE